MLYYLFRFLEQYDIPGVHLWGYISFRAILALVLALLISMWTGEHFIKWMKRHQLHEEQRDPSIDPYGVEKKGVPTMGGLVIIVSTLVPCLLLGRLRNIYMLLMLLTMLVLGTLGFADDQLKLKKSKEGMKPIVKLMGQAGIGLVVALTLWLSPDAVVRENITVVHQGAEKEVVYKSEPVKSTMTTIPFVKGNNLNYNEVFSFIGEHKTEVGWLLFVLMTTFVVMAVSNGANLNDGMDGMCAGNAAVMVLALGMLAYVSSHIELAGYLNIMFIPGSQELVVFCAAMMGALVGFLWYNVFPAQVFMGDTGSLPIGGVIAVLAVIIHKELLLPLLCFVWVMESVSSLLQGPVARWGTAHGRKLRLFKRAPIHDAYRVKPGQLPADMKVLINYPKGCFHESKITMRFWIVTIILAALTIITLKIR